MLDDEVWSDPGGHIARVSANRPKLELIRSRRLPRSGPAVAVDSRAHTAIGPERDRVLRPVIGRQRLVVTALKLHELPRRAPRSAAALCGGIGSRALQANTSRSPDTSGEFTQVRFM
jgi:hypothetical protein